MEIVWSTNARENIKTIYLFYFYKNQNVATTIYTKIIHEVNRLVNFPYIGKIEPLSKKDKREYRSLTIYPHYKAIYYIKDSYSINIIAIWDCRQNPYTLKRKVKQIK